MQPPLVRRSVSIDFLIDELGSSKRGNLSPIISSIKGSIFWKSKESLKYSLAVRSTFLRCIYSPATFIVVRISVFSIADYCAPKRGDS